MLLKRISELKKEKEQLLMKLELEEEMITNTLNRKLFKLQQEKIEMEVALEKEQEYIVNRLQKQLDLLKTPSAPGSPIHSDSAPSSVVDLLRVEVYRLLYSD